MSSFVVYGLNGHELMPLNQVFRRPGPDRVTAMRPAAAPGRRETVDERRPHQRGREAQQAYHQVKSLTREVPAVRAEQVMATPVLTIGLHAAIDRAVACFREHAFRHLPVTDVTGRLVGIVSDRDILRHLAAGSRDADETIGTVMKPKVLTATVDTDVRYIARLFVEQHVGALPIVAAGSLAGIVTRSDVLRAVVRHYSLELWA